MDACQLRAVGQCGQRADDLVARAAEEGLPGPVDAHVAVHRVAHHHRQGVALGHRRGERQLRAQLRLRGQQLGDVDAAAGETGQAAVLVQRDDGQFQAAGAVARTDDQHLGLPGRRARVGGEQRGDHRPRRRRHQAVQRLAPRLVRAAAAQPLPAGVDQLDGAGRVGAEQQLAHAGEHPVELAAARGQRRLRVVQREARLLVVALPAAGHQRQQQQHDRRRGTGRDEPAHAGHDLRRHVGTCHVDDDPQRLLAQGAESRDTVARDQALADPGGALGLRQVLAQRRQRGQVLARAQARRGGGRDHSAVVGDQRGGATRVVQRALLEVGEHIRVQQHDHVHQPEVGQHDRARMGQHRQALGHRVAAPGQGQPAPALDTQPGPLARHRQPWQPRPVHRGARLGRACCGEHRPLGVDDGHAAQRDVRGQGLPQRRREARVLGVADACQRVGHVGRGLLCRRDRARGVLLDDPHQQLVALQVVADLLRILEIDQGRHGRQQQGDEQQARMAQRAAGQQVAPGAQHRRLGGSGRGHGHEGAPSSTMGRSRWRVAAASRRPSAWMRATKPSTAWNQASSPGLTA